MNVGARHAAPTAAPSGAGGETGAGDFPRYALQEPLRWRCIDGDWLVFGTASGALLRPDPLAAAVLTLIEEAPSSHDEIVRYIAQGVEIDVMSQLVLRVGEIINDLMRAELVECRQP